MTLNVLILVLYLFREDINSVLMTAMQGLLEKYKIDPREIGRLEVRNTCACV